MAAVALLLIVPHAGLLAAVTVEIAAEAGPQANAHGPWLQLFSRAGATSVRVRATRAGESPQVEDFGTPERPRPKLTVVLARNGTVHAPGARFKLGEEGKLKEYLARLEDEGEKGVTAARGKFGLREEQFALLFDKLKAPMGSIRSDSSLKTILRDTERNLGVRIDSDEGAALALAATPEGAEKLAGLSTGTALAVLLKQEGLALEAGKPIGGAVSLRVVELRRAEETWPTGYQPESSPRETAPVLFEWVNVEIGGYSLRQTFDAIEPSLSSEERPLPLVWDHYTLRRDGIDPGSIQVSLEPKRTFFKRVIDKLAFQARLKAELRVDEAGSPFLWLTR